MTVIAKSNLKAPTYHTPAHVNQTVNVNNSGEYITQLWGIFFIVGKQKDIF